MSRRIVCGIFSTLLFAAPVYAEAPPGAEETKNGTIIWKAPRAGEASTAAPGKDSVIWNDDPKSMPSVKSTGTPDRNGIIWNDAPGAAATVKAAPPPPAAAPQSASVQENACREYNSEIMVEGRRQAMRGTACRQPDGRWRVISQVPR